MLQKCLALIVFAIVPSLAINSADVIGFWSYEGNVDGTPLNFQYWFGADMSSELRLHAIESGKLKKFTARGDWMVSDKYITFIEPATCFQDLGSGPTVCDKNNTFVSDILFVKGAGSERTLWFKDPFFGSYQVGSYVGTNKAFTLAEITPSTNLSVMQRRNLESPRNERLPGSFVIRPNGNFNFLGRRLLSIHR